MWKLFWEFFLKRHWAFSWQFYWDFFCNAFVFYCSNVYTSENYFSNSLRDSFDNFFGKLFGNFFQKLLMNCFNNSNKTYSSIGIPRFFRKLLKQFLSICYEKTLQHFWENSKTASTQINHAFNPPGRMESENAIAIIICNGIL